MKSVARFFSTIVFAALAMALVGCGTTKIVTVKETTKVVVTAPKTYTNPTKVPAPHFTKEQYMGATWQERAQFNSVLNVTLYESIGQCNADKVSLRTWETKEKAEVEKSNSTSK